MRIAEVYNGVEIYLTDDNKFQVKLDGQTFKRAAISPVRTWINQRVSGMPVIVYNRTDIKKPTVSKLIGFKDGSYGKIILTDGALRYDEGITPYSEEYMQKLEDLLRRYYELGSEYREFVQSLPRVKAQDLQAYRKKAKHVDTK